MYLTTITTYWNNYKVTDTGYYYPDYKAAREKQSKELQKIKESYHFSKTTKEKPGKISVSCGTFSAVLEITKFC